MSTSPPKVPGVNDRFAQFPSELAAKVRTMRLGASSIPTLLAHPDWSTPAPIMLWLHGRTVSKELDPGRYLRWLRAGIATCAIDLPGHGERFDESMQHPERTLDILLQAVAEIDQVVTALASPHFRSAFDLSRMGIGGMSAGGMTTLRRLCDPHRFTCAAVEGATGWLEGLYAPERSGMPVRSSTLHRHPDEKILALDPTRRLASFKPIPLLVLHSEQDQVVPWAGMRVFVSNLRDQYAQSGASPSLIEVKTWPVTGAPQEHSGFGRVSAEAKTVQTDFLAHHLGATPIEANT